MEKEKAKVCRGFGFVNSTI